MKTVTTIVMAIGIWFAGAPGLAQAESIGFGIVGAESPESLARMWLPLFNLLQEQTGIAVKPYFGKDYLSIVEGMKRGEIQVASFGNRSALDVVGEGPGEVFAQRIDDLGRNGYYSYLIALKGKPWKSFDDVVRDGKKIRFAFGDEKSTSGTLVPLYYLFAQRKLKAEDVFASVSRGNHELNMEAVLDGKVDVASCSSQLLDKIAVKEAKRLAKVKILWKSPLIPQDPLVWRKDLAVETKKKLRGFFLSFGKKPNERKLLIEHMGLSGFGPSDDSQLLPIRQLELYRQRQGVEAATDIPVKEQFRRLVEIDAQLAELSAKVHKMDARKTP